MQKNWNLRFSSANSKTGLRQMAIQLSWKNIKIEFREKPQKVWGALES